MPAFITITIPRAYTSAFAAELTTRYGQKAEAIYCTIADAESPLQALLAIQPHRQELTIIEHALDQLACGAERIDDADRPIRVDRALFNAALDGMLLDTIEDLDQARGTAPDTLDLDAMLNQHRRVGELLALLGEAQAAPSRSGVIVRMPPDLATQAAALACARGQSVEDLVREAVVTYLGKAGEPADGGCEARPLGRPSREDSDDPLHR